MNILAIDPGFDSTGWAVFTPEHPTGVLNEALGWLRASGEIRTDPGQADAARLRFLGSKLRGLIHDWYPKLAYVEMPPYEGSYTGGKERRRGVNRLYMATGAILSRLDLERVVQLPPVRVSKEVRHELLAAAARTISLELPEGPRGGAREDQWDAIWLGCQALLERGARDLNPETLFSAPRVSGSR